MSIAYSIVFPDQFQWCRSSSTMLGRDIIRFPVIKMRPCKRFHSLIQVQVSDRPATTVLAYSRKTTTSPVSGLLCFPPPGFRLPGYIEDTLATI